MFKQVLGEKKDLYLGMSKKDREKAIEKDEKDKKHKEKTKDAFAYAASLLDKK